MPGLLRTHRVIGGVCAALAARFDVSPTLVRLVFLMSCVVPGPQVALYLLLWLLIPRERQG
jgi:phage shock protein PspC (stress-responsive transcriptional regulator)